MPTPTLIQATGAVRGITTDEAGTATESVSVTYDDPKFYLLTSTGGRRGLAHNVDPSRTLSITGEVLGAWGADGLLGAKFGAEYAPTQQGLETPFTTTAAWQKDKWLLDTGTMDRNREAWESVSATFTEIPGFDPSAP